MARLPNPAWGLYVLIAGYLFYYGSAQTASSGFDGALSGAYGKSSYRSEACTDARRDHAAMLEVQESWAV